MQNLIKLGSAVHMSYRVNRERTATMLKTILPPLPLKRQN